MENSLNQIGIQIYSKTVKLISDQCQTSLLGNLKTQNKKICLTKHQIVNNQMNFYSETIMRVKNKLNRVKIPHKVLEKDKKDVIVFLNKLRRKRRKIIKRISLTREQGRLSLTQEVVEVQQIGMTERQNVHLILINS